MDVRGSRYTHMEKNMEVVISFFSLMESRGSFHYPIIGGSICFYCFHRFQDARMYYLKACMSFHIHLHTSTCLHEDHKRPALSTWLTLTLTVILPWSYIRESWYSSNFFRGSWGYVHGSWAIYDSHERWWKLPRNRWSYSHGSIMYSMEVGGSYHGRKFTSVEVGWNTFHGST